MKDQSPSALLSQCILWGKKNLKNGRNAVNTTGFVPQSYPQNSGQKGPWEISSPRPWSKQDEKGPQNWTKLLRALSCQGFFPRHNLPGQSCKLLDCPYAEKAFPSIQF